MMNKTTLSMDQLEQVNGGVDFEQAKEVLDKAIPDSVKKKAAEAEDTFKTAVAKAFVYGKTILNWRPW